MDSNQDAYVNELVQLVSGLLHFTWAWIRPPSGRVSDELEQLKGLIETNTPLNYGMAAWQWKLDNLGEYNSRLVSFKINELIIERPGQPHGTMKNNYIPQKIGIFVWRALRGRILTKVEFDKRGIDLDNILCPICNDSVETVEHTLITCKMAKDVWQAIYNWWESSPPNSSSLSDFFSGSRRRNLSRENKKIWQSIEWVTGYFIWKNRNLKVFRNDHWAYSKVASDIQVKTFEWMKNRSRHKAIDWIQWLTGPNTLSFPHYNSRDSG
ncbi:uncharacterized protein [Rutidosis leptorrhynchoides]|uniref:uncharacterized protein n=1 Tax=Rutidosis leptorrhynchoides TaxID=125765 RepID=UPI003A9A1AC4